jgi:hypothetical protein
MQRQITPQAVRADLAEIRREMKRLEAEERLLEKVLGQLEGKGPGEAKGATALRRGLSQKQYGARIADRVYDVLDPDEALPTREVAERVGVSPGTAVKYLRRLVSESRAKERSHNKRSDFTWSRNELRVGAGEGVR